MVPADIMLRHEGTSLRCYRGVLPRRASGLGPVTVAIMPIKVALTGHRGKTGSALVPSLTAAADIEYVGGVGRNDDLRAFLEARRPEALVDFTHPTSALQNAL